MKPRPLSRVVTGFTLIELLIVVSIIGLLASVILVGLRGFREAGRDARRIADLRQVQTGLELYFNKCRFYPGGVNPSIPCSDNVSITATDNSPPSQQGNSWRLMSNAVKGSGLNIASIPNDPLAPVRSYFYGSHPGIPNPADQSLHYVLKAELEDPNNQALADDLDGTTVFDVVINCGPSTGIADKYYCLGI